jgi:hypothetical protein
MFSLESGPCDLRSFGVGDVPGDQEQREFGDAVPSWIIVEFDLPTTQSSETLLPLTTLAPCLLALLKPFRRPLLKNLRPQMLMDVLGCALKIYKNTTHTHSSILSYRQARAPSSGHTRDTAHTLVPL